MAEISKQQNAKAVTKYHRMDNYMKIYSFTAIKLSFINMIQSVTNFLSSALELPVLSIRAVLLFVISCKSLTGLQSKCIQSPALVFQIASWMWVAGGDSSKGFYEQVTSARIMIELYNRLSGRREEDALQVTQNFIHVHVLWRCSMLQDTSCN